MKVEGSISFYGIFPRSYGVQKYVFGKDKVKKVLKSPANSRKTLKPLCPTRTTFLFMKWVQIKFFW